MSRYYFYFNDKCQWFCLTSDSLRQTIAMNKNADGTFRSHLPILFSFTGLAFDAERKEDAEEAFRKEDSVIACKEPACMLMARRQFSQEMRQRLLL